MSDRRPAPTRSPAAVAVLGDLMLSGAVEARHLGGDPAAAWGDTLPTLRAAALRVANLETVLARGGVGWGGPQKICRLRADPRLVGVLTAAGIEAVTLANNHALDYGPAGLLETLDVLAAARIVAVGAGADDEVAFAPVYVTAGPLRVGLVAFTDNEPRAAAGPARPGVAYATCRRFDAGARRVRAAVATARRAADVVLVFAHWGGNWGERPRTQHRRLGAALLRAGAAAVVGTSAHVPRGVRFRRRGPILLATGDALDALETCPVERNDLSFLPSLELEGGRVARVRLTPTRIRGAVVARATGTDRDVVVARMLRRCAVERSRATFDEASGTVVVTR